MNLKWYIHRLRAMNVRELRWRIEQKKIAKAEEKVFGEQKLAVTDGIFYPAMAGLTFHPERIVLPKASQPQEVSGKITLLCGMDYESMKKSWHAGFQTAKEWPLTYHSHLDYKQRDEIGDARTNWELNRHMQFAALGYAYRETGEEKYQQELMDLFLDWNTQNPYLWGISWTSAMEIAIRALNWIYTLYFVSDRAPKEFALCLSDGIINMITYLCAHYSRFSSANNHVIVEASVIGIAGIAFACDDWLALAISILQEEIPRQNFTDGVNREVSLHYQAFFMEAVGLLAIIMRHNQINVPMKWRYILSTMTAYLQNCQGSYGEMMVFGDDDEGRIVNLSGKKENYYEYVIALMREWLPKGWENETEISQVDKSLRAERFETKKMRCDCYPEGGISLIRSIDGEVFAGIDHGPLGFGSIAAHGHADALSFQLFLGGERVFADPGTGLYHIDLSMRNQIRSTSMHNTVTLDGKDQSEMLGAFLWGKRATTTLTGCGIDKEERIIISAEHNGYHPVIHQREYVWIGDRRLQITDHLRSINKTVQFGINYLLDPDIVTKETALGQYELTTQNGYTLHMCVSGNEMFTSTIADSQLADNYGEYRQTRQIRIAGETQKDLNIVTDIIWEKQ